MPATLRTSIGFGLRQITRVQTVAASRSWSSSAPCLAGPPPGNQPPSAKSAGRQSHLSADNQSSASKDENKTGDDHPAKQPDGQAPSSRSTGFNESATDGVKGGKEGLGARTDK